MSLDYDPGSHDYPTQIGTTYTISLVAVSDSGCVDSTYQEIGYFDDLLYYVPNTFIPDADPNKIKKIASFKVGVRYQFYHAFLLLFLGLIPKEYFNKRIVLVFILTLVGVVLFSFSIYLLSLKSQLGLESLVPILGPITPIGGLTLTIAWGVLIIYGIKLKKN